MSTNEPIDIEVSVIEVAPKPIDELRRAKVESAINYSMMLSGGVGIVPIPLVDFVGVTAIQLALVKQLSSLYGVEYTSSATKRTIGALIGGAIPAFGREGHMLCLGPTAKHTGEFNSARILDEVWMFGMPVHNPVVMRNKIRVMQMQGSSYIKGLEGLRISPSEGLEVKRRGAEVRISRAR